MKYLPSGVGSACVCMFAGSEPASTSVSANALIAPLASRGKILRLLLVGAEQLERLRQADRLVRRQQRGERSVLRRHHRHRLHITRIRKPEPAVFRRDLDPEGAHVAEFLDVLLGNLARAVDHVRIDALEELAQRVEERLGARRFLGVVGADADESGRVGNGRETARGRSSDPTTRSRAPPRRRLVPRSLKRAFSLAVTWITHW